MTEDPAGLADPMTLRCGATLRCRIAKSAMSDSLGSGTGEATPEQAALYGPSALALDGLTCAAMTVAEIEAARGVVLDPELPRHWLEEPGEDPAFPRFAGPLPPGGITAWYTMRIAALADATEGEYGHTPETALAAMTARDRTRAGLWRERFGVPPGHL